MAFQQRKWSSRWPSLLALMTAMMCGNVVVCNLAAPAAAADPPSSPPPSSPPRDPAQVELETRLRKMEESLRRMEEANTKIQSQYDSLRRKYDEMSKRNATMRASHRARVLRGERGWPVGWARWRPKSLQPVKPTAGWAPKAWEDARHPEGSAFAGRGRHRGPCSGDAGRRAADNGAWARWNDGVVDIGRKPPRRPGHWRPGNGGSRLPARERSFRGEEKVKESTAKVIFSEGLEFSSADEEFKITFHNLTQVEYRGFPDGDQGLLHSQFFIPRQRWYFTGRVTKNVEFYTVINRGYGPLDILDAFISYRIDERFRIRAGRMKTPYLYEYYSIAEGDLIAPERSLYAGNFATNRQIGVMALGELYKGRLGYAMGMYNGQRRSFEDTNSGKDFIGYINSRPFLTSERFKALNYLNLGGSWDVGYQNNPIVPDQVRTANDDTTAAGATTLSPTFLVFNNNVVEQGERRQWAGHMMWFYKSFSLLSEYGGGVTGLAHTNQSTQTYVPYNGYFVQATYFLTGEELTRRVNVVKPRRDFSLAKGKMAPGASRGPRPLQHSRHGQAGLHGGLRRPQLVVKSCVGDRHRSELVSELLHQVLFRLAAFRVR